MVYGTYNELVAGAYKPTFTSLRGPTLYVPIKLYGSHIHATSTSQLLVMSNVPILGYRYPQAILGCSKQQIADFSPHRFVHLIEKTVSSI